ncbi:carbohydrate-binding module family 52 protein [Corynascus novoguineensis]|uniref:Carbohydrate-binding module family 52 protein n=1 Tax=Corynascus novoguineensis TaxID=1126955 RepID=A0AAN7CQ06_9PEZI|nr:carbohydrate-binding module family 52 protein [Corynascus novoguineensis]
MPRFSLLTAAFLGLANNVLGDTETCGQAPYDPAQYVCWDNQFLCPIAAGEPLSNCAGACYSKFMYSCTENVLTLLPPVESPFTLTADNPNLPIHGKPVTAAGQHWVVAGETGSYCPEQVGDACPPGNETVIISRNGGVAMSVMVPGGQGAYLDPYWNMGYTQAHSAYIPPGSITTGFGAYEGGGFVNLNGNGWGWAACPPRASGGGGPAWNLVARNETNTERYNQCSPINLKINSLPSGTYGAWQYT